MSLKYDYLIVGAGITGATLARILTDRGGKVLVVDKNDYVGGACYTKMYGDLPVNQFGGHIFHTKFSSVWRFINKYSEFFPYEHRVKAKIEHRFYTIPINLKTLNEVFQLDTPEKAKGFFTNIPFVGDSNFEERAISTIGDDLYYKFFYYYTKKQWGMEPKELPAYIFSRLPVRFNLDDRYFTDPYQGMPKLGYTNLIQNLLDGIEIKLETPFDPSFTISERIIYTGSIDEYYNYAYGKLPYRSIKHEWTIEDVDSFGGATINHTGNEVTSTRTVTFNHFYPNITHDKFITVREWATDEGVPLYPISIKKNLDLYEKYKAIPTNIIFAGRLGAYKYINMDIAVKEALDLGETL